MGIEFEVRVEHTLWIYQILLGCVHHDPVVGLEYVWLGKSPLGELIRIVGRVPALKVDRFGIAIMKLEPVRILSLEINKSPNIAGYQFTDHHVGGEQIAWLKLFQTQTAIGRAVSSPKGRPSAAGETGDAHGKDEMDRRD